MATGPHDQAEGMVSVSTVQLNLPCHLVFASFQCNSPSPKLLSAKAPLAKDNIGFLVTVPVQDPRGR